jgi:hypothetical protein
LAQIDGEFGACFLIFVDVIDSTGRALMDAAAAAERAANACWEWEHGGDPEPVSTTAALVYQAATVAVEAATADELITDPLEDPQTRRSRLAAAAWMLVLAGTDEGGESIDLTLAGQLFRAAAAS